VINQDFSNNQMPVLLLVCITLVNAAIVMNFLFLGLGGSALGPGTVYIYLLVAVELVCVYQALVRGRRGHRVDST